MEFENVIQLVAEKKRAILSRARIFDKFFRANICYFEGSVWYFIMDLLEVSKYLIKWKKIYSS